MSYRELRNFTEMMRAIGYPRIISIENFRSPNFELVSDILYWMVKMYDPEANISDRVEFESERIQFLTSIESHMSSKARIKLNTKKLYAADGRAVQEMLKIAFLLYNAVRFASKPLKEEMNPPPIKLQDVKSVRVLATEITQTGAKLYDLLTTEAIDRQDRLRALRFLDAVASATDGSREHAFVERSLKDALETARQKVEDTKKECEELEVDERNIKLKISRKREELERLEKKLRSGDNSRPQFMDEVEKLEQELSASYEVYMDRHRNLDYLELELKQYREVEEERQAQQAARVQRMRERLLKEEVELLRGGGHDIDREGDGEVDNDPANESGTKENFIGSVYNGNRNNGKNDNLRGHVKNSARGLRANANNINNNAANTNRGRTLNSHDDVDEDDDSSLNSVAETGSDGSDAVDDFGSVTESDDEEEDVVRRPTNGTRAKTSAHIANELNKYGSSGNRSKLTGNTRKFESRGGGHTGRKGQARSSSVIATSNGSSRRPATLNYDEDDDDDDDEDNDDDLSQNSDDNF